MNKRRQMPYEHDPEFKIVSIQKKKGGEPIVRFLTREEVGELPVPVFISFADFEEKHKPQG